MSIVVPAAAGLVEPGSPASIVLFALVSLGVIGLVVTILLRTRRRQRDVPPRPRGEDRDPGADGD
ncbi:hypothetical protein [Kocuria turfanensis]|uniref:Uncharacterized protein n=1 Tax=Kocuria turfanensis TaxID=388357 RepID=A0A512IDD0_9MICC|nr:hypothetical protein [Kocuria turfanensis]GEO95702.1 hypothetical protein KTU01_18250 [Kocuria turfanensis]